MFAFLFLVLFVFFVFIVRSLNGLQLTFSTNLSDPCENQVCHHSAMCNQSTNFVCVCNDGFVGNGSFCEGKVGEILGPVYMIPVSWNVPGTRDLSSVYNYLTFLIFVYTENYIPPRLTVKRRDIPVNRDKYGLNSVCYKQFKMALGVLDEYLKPRKVSNKNVT